MSSTYGKFQDNKCSCCANIATTLQNEEPMCLGCASQAYRRRRPKIARCGLFAPASLGQWVRGKRGRTRDK